MPPARARRNRSARRVGVEVGQDQEIADVEHARGLGEHGVEVLGDESSVGPHGVDEAAILAPHVDDQGLAGRLAWRPIFSAEQSTPWRTERLGGETSEDVVADPGTDRRADPQPGEVDGRVGRPAADVQDQVVHGDQLAGPRQVVERRGDVVGDDQSGTDDGRGGLDGHGGDGHDRLPPGEGGGRGASAVVVRGPAADSGRRTAGRGLRTGCRSRRRPHPCAAGRPTAPPRRSRACRRAPRARARSGPRVR